MRGNFSSCDEGIAMQPGVQPAISLQSMSGFQIFAVAICWTINMLDGFDVLAIAFTAPEISREWQLSPAALGIVFSAGLFGMTIGALVLAPVADIIGRRWTIIIGLVVITIGMVATAFVGSVTALFGTRFLTGLGIGGLLASLTTMVSEYSSERRRNLAISLFSLGYPVGATIGGSTAVFLISAYDWRSVFIFGGLLSALMIPLALWRLPESIDFLVTRRPRGWMEKTNKILARIGQPAMTAPPESDALKQSGGIGLTRIVAAPFLRSTMALWAAAFMSMLVLYFLLNWTPQVLVSAGLRLDQGISAGVLLNVGGGVGMVLLGYFSTRLGLKRMISYYFLGGSLGLVAFGLTAMNIVPLLVITFFTGFFVMGSLIGLYVIAARIYPPEIRSTGVGWSIGIGRLGAVFGPYLAGVMIGQGLDRSVYFLVFAVPLLIAIGAVGLITRQLAEDEASD